MKKLFILLWFVSASLFAQTKMPIQLLNPSGSISGQVIESTGATTAPAWTTITLFSYPGAGIPNSTGSAWGTSYSTTGTGTVVLNTAPTLSGLVTTGSLKANATISGSASSGAINYGTLSYSDTNLFESYQTSANSYAQSIWQNTNSGPTASTDLVLSNDQGTSTTHYANFGINSSGFTGAGSLNLPGASYLTGTTSDLVIGTTTSNAIHFLANSSATDAATITTGNVFTLISSVLGTPNSGVITNLSGTCASCSIGGNAGTANSATTAGTVTTAAQPAITSVGTLTSVNSSGNINISKSGTSVNYSGNDTGGSNSVQYQFQNNGVNIWSLENFTSTSIFTLNRYNSGTLADNPISVSNSTGIVSFVDGISSSLITATSTVNLSPASANVSISPTGTGTVTINPATASSMNNVSLGLTTPLAVGSTSIAHTLQELDTGYTFNTPTTGATVTLATGTETALIVPAGTLAALTITLPGCTSGYNGSIARFSSTQIITALTVNATSGTVADAPTTLALGSGHGYLCRGSTTTWYQLY